jgi:hypothetical protein
MKTVAVISAAESLQWFGADLESDSHSRTVAA